MSDDAEWKSNPKTIEEVLDSIGKQNLWEVRNGRRASVPLFLTSELVAEIGARIIVLEEKLAMHEEVLLMITKHLNYLNNNDDDD